MKIEKRYESLLNEKDKLEGKKDVVETIGSHKVELKEKKFDDIIEKIKEERNNIIHDINKRKSKKASDLQYRLNQLHDELGEIERIIKFLKNKDNIEKSIDVDFSKIRGYNSYVEDVGFVYEDKYLIVKLFIAGNRKPKNKFSLVYYGFSCFDKFMDLPYSYGLPTNDINSGVNVCGIIKSLPSIEELKSYIVKNKEKILKKFIRNHKEIIEEYKNALKYDLNSFEEAHKPTVLKEKDAKVICIVDGKEWRLYNDYVYVRTKKDENLLRDFIKIGKKYYEKYSRVECLFIEQMGNTTFGDWWSMKISRNFSGILFNKSNFEREFNETKSWIDIKNEGRINRIHFSYPKIEWVNPDLIPIVDFDKIVEGN